MDSRTSETKNTTRTTEAAEGQHKGEFPFDQGNQQVNDVNAAQKARVQGTTTKITDQMNQAHADIRRESEEYGPDMSKEEDKRRGGFEKSKPVM